MDSSRRMVPSVAMIAVPTLSSGRSVGTAISVPALDHRPQPSVQGNGTSVSALPSVRAMNMPVNVCEASVNREKRSRPSNTVVVDVNVGVAVGDRASVIVISTCDVFVSGREVADGTTCGAQAVTANNVITTNILNKRLVNILISLNLAPHW